MGGFVDDPNKVNQEESVTDETSTTQETEEQESVSTESDEITETDESGSDESATTDEYQPAEDDYSDEVEYLAKRGINGVKNLDEFVEKYHESQRKLNEREAQKPEQKPTQKEDAPSAPSVFGRSVLKGHIQKMVASGQIPADKAGDWLGLSSVVDGALDESFGKMDQFASGMFAFANTVLGQLRDQSWSTFQFKDKVGRRDLDKIIEANPLWDYNKAFRAYIVDNPDALTKLQQGPRKDNKNNGQRGKFKRFDPARRSKPVSQTSGVNWKKYWDRDRGNFAGPEWNGMSSDERLKILNAYEKDTKQGG